MAAGTNRVCVNVGGVRHEIYRATLRKIPATRLVVWRHQDSRHATGRLTSSTSLREYSRHATGRLTSSTMLRKIPATRLVV